MEITQDPITDPAVIALLEEHLDEMRRTSPPESVHALDLDGLRSADVTFFVAREGGQVLGCGALKRLDPAHGEIKSMRTAADAQRRGVATAMVAHLVEAGRTMGLDRLSLETGSADFFAPARALYARHGFVECPPFGSYRLDPESTFMTRTL